MKRLLIVAALCCIAFNAMAAPVATATVGETTATCQSVSGVTLLTVDWASSTTGACTASISDVYGTIQRITVNPDAGATSPTASYDATLSDADGFDVLIGHGANLDAAVTSSFASMVEETTSSGCMPVCVMGTLSLSITSAGSQRGGLIRIYLKP